MASIMRPRGVVVPSALSSILVKSATLLYLKNEKNILVKRAICGMISAIASFEMESNQWPEVLTDITTVISYLQTDL